MRALFCYTFTYTPMRIQVAHRAELYGSFVWILSGSVILIYVSFALLGHKLPGIEELVDFLTTIPQNYIFLAACISMFIEGLYFIGSFFPGTSLVILISILSQSGGLPTFLITMIFVFFGWCLAGGVNILLARFFMKTLVSHDAKTPYEVKDNADMTWFPAFRANYEVAQVSEGGDPLSVFISSVRVKALTCIGAVFYSLVIAYFIDLQSLEYQEVFRGLAVIGIVTLLVGLVKVRKAVTLA